jgi:hypothetical protein
MAEQEGVLANAEPVEEKGSETEELTTTTPPDGALPVDAPQRPDYIPENFWNVEKGEVNIEGMAKSYSELRKAFNERNNDKPAEDVNEYFSKDYFTDEGMLKTDKLELSKDDPALKAAFEAAKNSGMGIKQANEFISQFVDGMSEFLPEQVDVKEELGKLGDNGEKLVSGIKIWVDGMLKNGDIDDGVHAEILNLGKTAAGIKALDVLRQKTGEMTLPIGEALSGSVHMSLNDWYTATYETHAEAGESRQAFQERMHELGKKLIGTGHGTYTGSGYGVK